MTDRGDPIGGAMELLDSENFAAGVGMTQQGRASLMAKLAEGHNAGAIIHIVIDFEVFSILCYRSGCSYHPCIGHTPNTCAVLLFHADQYV